MKHILRAPLSLLLVWVLALAFTHTTTAYGQASSNKVEQLTRLLSAANTDSSRISVLHQLFDELLNYEPAKARKYATEALELAKSSQNHSATAESLDKFGIFYRRQGDYRQATDYFEQALQLRQRHQLNHQLALSYNHLANMAVIRGDNERALQYYQTALNIRRDNKDPEGIAVSLANLGGFYYRLKDFTNSIDHHQRALAIADSIGNKGMVNYNLYRLGEGCFLVEDYKNALKYYRQLLYTAQAQGDKFEMQRAYQGISKVYAKIGDYKQAYEYYQYHSIAKEQMYEEKSSQRIEQVQAEKEQTNNELMLINQQREEERKRNRLVRIFLAVAFLLASSIVVILYRNNQQKQRTNFLLEQQKREIERKSQELEKQTAQIEQQNQSITRNKDTLERAFTEIERKNKEMTASINYAQRIQQAMLPLDKMIVRHLPEHFILFRPRDIVSGDFYWFLEKDDKIFLAAVDCTGHGIPGAFMSLIGSDYLTHIINLQQIEHPTEILNQLHFSITKALKQEETDNRDGMDVAMCVIDKKSNTLQYAGAARPLLYVQDNEMKELLSTKLPIGGFQIETERDFVTYTIPIDRPTTFYIYSDGYQDQFGGPKGRKFAQKKLKSLLFDIHHLPAKEQKKALETTLDDWMQDNRQMDDILIIGVHLSPLHKS